MSDLASTGGVEGWMRRVDRTIRTLESAMGKARVPRNCVSTARPDPAKLQPGVPVFETDTGYLLLVNAAQDDFEVFRKYAAPVAPPAQPTLVDGTADIVYSGSVVARNATHRLTKFGRAATLNLNVVTGANQLTGNATLLTLPAAFAPLDGVLFEGPAVVLTNAFAPVGIAHLFLEGSALKIGRMVTGTALPLQANCFISGPFPYPTAA